MVIYQTNVGRLDQLLDYGDIVFHHHILIEIVFYPLDDCRVSVIRELFKGTISKNVRS